MVKISMNYVNEMLEKGKDCEKYLLIHAKRHVNNFMMSV